MFPKNLLLNAPRYGYCHALCAAGCGRDPQCAVFIRTVAWSFGFIGLQFALIGVLRASGNAFEGMLISLVSQWVLQFPLAYILSEHTALHAHGQWWAFPASNVATALIAGVWFGRGDWKKGRLVARDETDAQRQDVADNVQI
jgi:Na+-driven multidrug efflux pump